MSMYTVFFIGEQSVLYEFCQHHLVQYLPVPRPLRGHRQQEVFYRERQGESPTPRILIIDNFHS